MPRVTWDDLPASVRARVQRGLGALVVEHRSYPGGYSPGTADRVVAANGSVAFVKAVHPEQNPSTPALHLAELRVMRSLPPGLPVPALLDGFESDGWVVLVLEHVDGAHPAQPWRRDEFLAVVDAVLDLADRLTPSPLEADRPSTSCATAGRDGHGAARIRCPTSTRGSRTGFPG